uniref:hypothetical protein n=1 Tax=Chroothece richteriana TaxID=101928 RepID=UPI001FCD3201|nr:hypothetical protein MW631_pgp141 [Chroothece richteriana]UNJ14167.1 hypothetical protein [Chroothece richteriana]
MSQQNSKLTLSSNHKILKVITGINNHNFSQINNVVLSSDQSAVTYIDVAANCNLVYSVKQITKLPICISCIDPSGIYKCIQSGADIVEIGNYDNFYKSNHFFSIKRLITITQEVRQLFPNICLCVTIPHYLSTKEQIMLARKLYELDVNILQTEGITSHQEPNMPYILSQTLAKVSATLAMTQSLTANTPIPIVAASGITPTTLWLALQYGANGVGIGTCISSLAKKSDMFSMLQVFVKISTKYSSQTFVHGVLNLSFAKNFTFTKAHTSALSHSII